jgi:prephenate dehydrogenase
MGKKVLLIGLNQANTAIGTALGRTEDELLRMGFDPDNKLAKQAKAQGVVDRVLPHPRQAIESADLVIFDLPPHELLVYLDNLGDKIKPDTVIIDTGAIKAPFFQWVADHLPDGRPVIGATPIQGALDLLDVDEPDTVDRYKGGLLAITSLPKTPENAMALAINLAKLLDAKPFFIDIEEIDAATAATYDLPTLVGAALFQSTATSPSWREFQRLAGTLFMKSTETCQSDPQAVRDLVSANRQKIISRLDAFVEELSRLRSILASEGEDEIAAYFEEAEKSRQQWLNARARGDWAAEELKPLAGFERPNILGSLLGLSRPKTDKK